MGKNKKGTDDGASKFDGFGVDFKCKLIGVADVSAPRGDEMCQSAMLKLAAQALKDNKEKKAHKQRITVNITFKGIRLLDEASEKIEYAHPIHRISFISHDDKDKRTFGYVVGTREGYKLFAIKAMKEAEQVTKTLKDLFQEVFVRHQAEKNKENAQPEAQATEVAQTAEEKPEEVGDDIVKEAVDPFLVDWGQLNEQIEVMQHDDSGMKHSDTGEIFSDISFRSNGIDPFVGDTFTSKVQTSEQDFFNSFGGNEPSLQQKTTAFNVFESSAPLQYPAANRKSPDVYALSAPPAQTRKETDEPLLLNDPFAELKKNINELHQQNLMQQQQQFPYHAGYNQGFSGLPKPYQPSQPFGNNPFATPGFGGNNIVCPPMQQPVTLPRVQPTVGTNPFLSQPTQEDMGWTITKPSPAPQKPVLTSNGPDPFAFLDNQIGSKPQATMSTSSNAGNDVFDLLG